MGIKIANIKVNGKRVSQREQLAIAEEVKAFLKDKEIVADVKINRFYSDRWFDTGYILACIEESEKHKEERRAKEIQWKKEFWEGKHDKHVRGQVGPFWSIKDVLAHNMGHRRVGKKDIIRAEELFK